MRHNQIVLEQESQLNAPDPRETHPPCYEDAIRLPRLIRSTISLKRVDLISHDISSRTRSRSEENFSGRSSFAIKKPSQPLAIHKSKENAKNKRQTCTSNQSVLEVIDQLETVNGNSPYAKRKVELEPKLVNSAAASTSTTLYRHAEANDRDDDEFAGIIMIENHYRSENNLTNIMTLESSSFSSTSSSSSFDSDEYFKLSTNS